MATGGNPEGGASPAASREEAREQARYVKKADAICQRWAVRIQEDSLRNYQGDLNGSAKAVKQGVAALTASLRKYGPGDLEAEKAELSALKAPEAAEEARGALLASLQVLITQVEADPRTAVTTGENMKNAEVLTQPYGFTSCGQLVGLKGAG